MTLRILAPHFVAGIVVGERAAPILRYMESWTHIEIERYCAQKGWICERIS